MHRRVLLLLVLGVVMCLPVVAHAVPTITVGNYFMDPTDTIVVTLTPTNADLVGGIDFRNWINGGVAGGPYITAMTGFGDGDFGLLFGGGGFGAINTGPPDGVFDGGLNTGTQTAASAVIFAPKAANSQPLTSITLVTNGAAPGVYTWSLVNPGLLGATTFVQPAGAGIIPTNLVAGTITVVPEPGSVVLGLFAAAGLAAVMIRRRRRVA